MTALDGFQLVRELHSQPRADILLCLDAADPAAREVVVKQIHLSARSSTASANSASSANTNTNAAAVDATREGEVVRRLLQLPRHANIVRYHRVVDQAKAQLIVMEHCPRGDLLAWLHAQPARRFAERDALVLFQQIAHAVQFLHAHGIAHCDVSLENVLCASDGDDGDDDNDDDDANASVKLCDLGLACAAAAPSTQRIGKLNYMAPEVVRGDVYDPVRADVWSLGIVLFMLLTGSPLFELAVPEDPAYVCVQRLGVRGVLENWGFANAVGDDTVALLAAMLQLDCAARLGSVDAVLDRLHP